MNEFQQEILDDLKDISPNIKDYLDNKLYDNEFEDTDMVTPTAIFNLVMGLVDQELIVLGVELSEDVDVRHDVDSIQLVRDVRILFDRVNFLKTLTETSLELDGIIDEAHDEVKESTFIHRVLDLLAEHPAYSAIVDRINNVNHMFSSNYDFLKHVETLHNKSVEMAEMHVPDNAADYLTIATKFVLSIEQKYRSLHSGGINKAILIHVINILNRIVASIPSNLYTLYLDKEDTNPFFYNGDDPQEVTHLKKHSSVFLEYWSDRNESIPETILQMIVVVTHRDCWTEEDYTIWLRGYNLSDADKTKYLELYNLLSE